jgi:integrase
LGYWVASLLSRKVRKDGFLSLNAIKRYFTALSPAFESLGHSCDPELANEDDITEFYSGVLESRKLDNIEFVFGRLKEFHQWLSNLIEIDDPVWAELPYFDGSVAVDPGIVTETDYLSAFGSLARSAATNEMARFAAFPLLGASRFGMRGSEVLGLLRSDWIPLGQAAIVVVQDNRFRKLKRPSSRRVIPLASEFTPAEQKLITWIHAVAEARSGDDMSALLLPAANRRIQQQIRRVALNALKSATGNPASNIHRLRHSAANRILLSLANIDRDLWKKTTRFDSGKVQNLLLGREGTTRRVAWAAARYLGHAGPDTAFRSYYHCISDLAEMMIGLPSEAPKQLTNAIDLEGFPRQILAPPSRLTASQDSGTAGVKDSIKALRLLARGKCAEEIASWLGRPTEPVARLEAAAAAVSLRMYGQMDDDSQPRLEWLKRIRHDGWGRLLRVAGEIDARFPQGLPGALSLAKAEKIVGRSRQLLAWRSEHFVALAVLVKQWGIARDQFVMLMSGNNSRLKELAIELGFTPGNAKTHGARVAGQQIDSAFDDDEQMFRVAARCALCLREDGKAAIRNRSELIAALFSICEIADGN